MGTQRAWTCRNPKCGCTWNWEGGQPTVWAVVSPVRGYDADGNRRTFAPMYKADEPFIMCGECGAPHTPDQPMHDEDDGIDDEPSEDDITDPCWLCEREWGPCVLARSDETPADFMCAAGRA